MFSSGETKHRPWNSYPRPVLRGTLPVACSITGCAPVHESCVRYIGFANLCKPVRSCRLPQFRTPTRFQGVGEHFLHVAAFLSPSVRLDGTASGALPGDRQTQACRIPMFASLRRLPNRADRLMAFGFRQTSHVGRPVKGVLSSGRPVKGVLQR